MTQTARVADGVVQEILMPLDGHTIEDCFPAALLAECVQAPDNVEPGWTYDGTAFAAPVAPTPQPITTFDFLAFMGLFTADEQAAVVNSTDTQVKLFLLMASGAGYIDLNDARTKAGVAALVSKNLLTTNRAAQVLAGTVPA